MTGETKMAGVKGNPINWVKKKNKDELIKDFQKALLQNDYHIRSVFKVSLYAKTHLETNTEYFRKHPLKPLDIDKIFKNNKITFKREVG